MRARMSAAIGARRDGLLATFDGPAPALSCAAAIRRSASQTGLAVRAAVHVGEVERVGGDVRGVAVHETARILSLADANEVLASELTHTIAAAAGHRFEDRGLHDLKGLSGPRRLYALASL